jgi:hypothetical protein
MDLAPITAGRLRELEAEVTELKDVASRKTAMIHRLAAELHKRNEAAKV